MSTELKIIIPTISNDMEGLTPPWGGGVPRLGVVGTATVWGLPM